MSILAKQKIAAAWSQIIVPRALGTPSKGNPFAVVSGTVNEVTLEVGTSKSWLKISRENFEATIDYLNTHDHGLQKPCHIDSNTKPELAGPLCLASRKTPAGSDGTRVITYVLPILADVGVVGIDGSSPATTWLI